MDLEQSFECAICKAKFNEDELCKHTQDRIKQDPQKLGVDYFVCCFDCCKDGKGRNIPV